MMTRTGKRRILLIFGIFGALAALFPVKSFTLSVDNQHCLLPVSQFSLQWRHSVERQLWQEHYQHQGDQLLLDSSFMQTFGAGTPSQGQQIAAPTGFVGYQQAILYHELNWTISRRMEGTILLADQQLPLYQWLPDYSVITIRPTYTSWLTRFAENLCYDRASD